MRDANFWRGKRVLVTGHTGFKGGWLTLWLDALGAHVTGLALAPSTTPDLFTSARVDIACDSCIVDLRDAAAVATCVRAARPDVVFHLAAQPLVRASYAFAADTWMTNVMGTVFLLEALRDAPSVRAIVVVTSDKCYEQSGPARAFREDDALGGHDPYSSSKAAAEIATASWRRSFLAEAGVGVATARAGNVIGGGDWAVDRLVPDLVRATVAGTSVAIRSPRSTRPWQHVLDPLDGYLRLARKLFDDPNAYSGAWNFGPDANDAWTVTDVAQRFTDALGRGRHWHVAEDASLHEAAALALDSGKSRERLSWSPSRSIDDAIRLTAEVYRSALDGMPLHALIVRQITGSMSLRTMELAS